MNIAVGLGKIAVSFRQRRDRHSAPILWPQLALLLLGEEEKELSLPALDDAGNVDGPAQIAARSGEAIWRIDGVGAFAEGPQGVEGLVARVPVRGAVRGGR